MNSKEGLCGEVEYWIGVFIDGSVGNLSFQI